MDELYDLEACAYHESAHAVVARVLGTPVRRVLIYNRRATLVRHGDVAATRTVCLNGWFCVSLPHQSDVCFDSARSSLRRPRCRSDRGLPNDRRGISLA